MAEWEKSVLSRAVHSGAIEEMLARGVDATHFSDERCKAVWTWLIDHTQKYRQAPSLTAAKEEIAKFDPDFRFEVVTDSTEYIVGNFFNQARRRAAVTALREIAGMIDNPDMLSSIDEHFLDKGRELSRLVPSSATARYSKMDERIEKYHLQSFIGSPSGIPYGIPRLDNATFGIQKHEYVTVSGYSGLGKALALDTPIPTPDGWSTQGALRIGDRIFDETGAVRHVVAVGPILEDRPCRVVRFVHGGQITADAEHEWCVLDRRGRSSIVETDEMKYRFSAIPMAPGLDLDEGEFVIPPYVLGVWLGDGHTADGRITSCEPEIMDRIREHYEVREGAGGNSGAWGIIGLKVQLREIGALDNKHIPANYLRASKEQRLELLRGLMDTDGYMNVEDGCEFCTTRKSLAFNVVELLTSLGFRVGCYESRAMLYGKDCGPKWRIHFRPGHEDAVFHLKRHLARQFASVPRTIRSRRRYVESVEDCWSVPVRCIETSAPSGLYLAGDEMVPTHNSTLTLFFLFQAYLAGFTPMLFSLEMESEAIMRKFDTLTTNFSSQALKAIKLKPNDIERWEEAAARAKEAVNDIIVLDDVGRCTTERIFAEMNRYKPDLVAVDYVSLMDAPRGGMAHWEGVTMITKGLKAIARDMKIPIIGVAQSNDENTGQSSIAHSKSIFRDSDIVIGLNQDDDMKDAQKMEIKLIKNRDGRLLNLFTMWDVDHMLFEQWSDARMFDKIGSHVGV